NPDYRRDWGVVTLDENGGLVDYRNNWCASQMARDATTGELIWAYNITPADPWDLDEPLITPLIDLEFGGTMRQTAVKASRSGYFYVWDRATGEIINDPWMFEYADFRGGVDPVTGRPSYIMEKWPFTNVEDRRRYTEADPGRNADGTTVADYTGTEVVWCPGTNARNWENDAWSPRTGLLYTSTSTDCRTMVVFEGDYVPGEGYTLQRAAGPAARLGMNGEPITHQSTLQANSPTESRTVWKVLDQFDNRTPVMVTAGDVLFQGGDEAGVMRGYNAMTGEIAWEFRTGSRFNQSAISYLGPDGNQYIAIIASSAAANTAVALDAAPDDANRYRRSGSTLYVFALPETVAAQ
ncbi:MAG: hypothetical protein AB7U48_13265, partial [Bauldia sp.]